MYSLDEVKKVDPEIADAIVAEQERQNSHIELIASENWVSKAVMAEAQSGRILLRDAGKLLGVQPAKLKAYGVKLSA